MNEVAGPVLNHLTPIFYPKFAIEQRNGVEVQFDTDRTQRMWSFEENGRYAATVEVTLSTKIYIYDSYTAKTYLYFRQQRNGGDKLNITPRFHWFGSVLVLVEGYIRHLSGIVLLAFSMNHNKRSARLIVSREYWNKIVLIKGKDKTKPKEMPEMKFEGRDYSIFVVKTSLNGNAAESRLRISLIPRNPLADYPSKEYYLNCPFMGNRYHDSYGVGCVMYKLLPLSSGSSLYFVATVRYNNQRFYRFFMDQMIRIDLSKLIDIQNGPEKFPDKEQYLEFQDESAVTLHTLKRKGSQQDTDYNFIGKYPSAQTGIPQAVRVTRLFCDENTDLIYHFDLDSNTVWMETVQEKSCFTLAHHPWDFTMKFDYKETKSIKEQSEKKAFESLFTEMEVQRDNVPTLRNITRRKAYFEENTTLKTLLTEAEANAILFV